MPGASRDKQNVPADAVGPGLGAAAEIPAIACRCGNLIVPMRALKKTAYDTNQEEA